MTTTQLTNTACGDVLDEFSSWLERVTPVLERTFIVIGPSDVVCVAHDKP